MDEHFAQQLIEAANSRANLGNSPIQTASNAGQMANLQSLAQIGFRDAGSANASRAFGGEASNVARREEEERDAAARMAAIIAQREEADIARRQAEFEAESDPKNYRQVVEPGGGYKFFNPRGEEIEAAEYAQATNKRLTEVLKKSQNPRDQQFLRDYQDLSRMQQALRGSPEQEEEFFNKNPGLQRAFNEYLGAGMSRGQAFMSLAEEAAERNRHLSSTFQQVSSGAPNIRRSEQARGEGGFRWPWERD